MSGLRRSRSAQPDLFAERLADEPALAWRSVPDAGSFADELARRRATTSGWLQFGAVVVAAAVSGFVAVAAAFVNNSAYGAGLFILVPILVAPVVEELAKAAGALYLAERKPWLVPGSWALVVTAVASAAVFATVENLYYLNVLIEDPSRGVTLVRWIGGSSLHTTASLLAGLGVARMWRRGVEGGRVAEFGDAQPFFIAAMLLHGTWNLGATILAIAEAV